MSLLGSLITVTMLLNMVVWLLISCLILYNVVEYTIDKHHARKDLSPFFKKYARWI